MEVVSVDHAGRRARVTTSYKPVLDDELTLEVGDIITNIVDVDVGWCEGELNEEKGMFPNNFVELYTELIPRASEEMVVPQPTTTTSASNAGKIISFVHLRNLAFLNHKPVSFELKIYGVLGESTKHGSLVHGPQFLLPLKLVVIKGGDP